MTPTAEIIDRGRGPEIKGTRITVYDVMDYYTHGYHRDQIAVILRLGSNEVEAAIRYIEEHREEVDEVYREILERSARGNPPEVEAKLQESRKRLQAKLDELRRGKREDGRGEADGGRQH